MDPRKAMMIDIVKHIQDGVKMLPDYGDVNPTQNGILDAIYRNLETLKAYLND